MGTKKCLSGSRKPAMPMSSVLLGCLLAIAAPHSALASGINTLCNGGESCTNCCTRLGATCQAGEFEGNTPTTEAEMAQLASDLGGTCSSYRTDFGSTTPFFYHDECYYNPQGSTTTCEAGATTTWYSRACPCYLCDRGSKKVGS